MIENKAYSDEEIDALINSTYDPKQHGLNLNWSLVIFSAIFFFPITLAYVNSKLTPEFLFHKIKSPQWRNKLITFLKKESCVSYDYKVKIMRQTSSGVGREDRVGGINYNRRQRWHR